MNNSRADGDLKGDQASYGGKDTRRRLRWRPLTLSTIVGAGFALWGLRIGLGSLADNSFFTHLATGRLTLESGIPTRDPYSFTAPGTPWVVQSWLASLLYALTDRFAGPGGIRIVMGVTCALLAALIWMLSRSARTLVARICIVALCILVGMNDWSPRPLLFGLVFMALTMLALEDRIPAWILLPTMWAWLNIHGSFPLGIVAIVCVYAGSSLDREATATPRRCLGWALAGVMVGMLNPLGPVLVLFPVRLLARRDVLGWIVEWKSPSFSTPWARLFLLQTIAAVILLVRRPSYRSAVPLVVFLAAALLGARNVAVASIVMVPGMARGFVGLGSLEGSERPRGTVLAAGGLSLIAVLLIRVGLSSQAYDLSSFPVDAVAYVDEIGWFDSEVRIASQDITGNYLTLLYGSRNIVFIDDRYDMYPESVIEDYKALYWGESNWQRVIEDNRLDAVIWESTTPLASLLRNDPEWKITYQDSQWIVACVRDATAFTEGRESC